MGCPGSGDWRPAPARRAISPGAHVTAALVRSRSTPLPPPTSPPPPSPLSLHLPTPHLPPRRELPAASGQLGTAILGLQRVARERGGIGRRALRAPGLWSGPPPIFGPLLPRLTPPAHFQLPPRASLGREREWSREREGAREREGGDGALADIFFKRVGVGVIAGRLLWLLNFKLPCTRLPVCWER